MALNIPQLTAELTQAAEDAYKTAMETEAPSNLEQFTTVQAQAFGASFGPAAAEAIIKAIQAGDVATQVTGVTGQSVPVTGAGTGKVS